MTKDNNETVTQKRKTLSLKTNIGISATKPSSSKTVEVEIKRKKHGLVIDIEETQLTANPQILTAEASTSGNLTDEEFKTRIKALQNAMKEEEIVAEERYKQQIVTESQKEESVLDQVEEKKESSPIVEEKKYTRQIPKKKEQFIPSSPVVFRANDYHKKPVSKPLTETKLPNQLNMDTAAAPEKPLPSRLKIKEKVNEPVDLQKKKSKLVVKEKHFEKKSQSTGKISRVVLGRVLNNETEERERSMAALKRARMKLKNTGKDLEAVKVIREVSIPDTITVGDLANRMAVRSADVVKYLMSIGTFATINQSIDGETAEIICTEFGHTPKRISESDIENELENIQDNEKDLTPRAPIVAIMGHVDHGKTTLLDTLRKTSIAQKEAGGITQHVAAYQIEAKNGKKITFIDTPGHAAFSNIRARGAVITDIIVLVVAADDGIKEQTIEVIHQAKAQKVPLVIAINKIDKPNINVDKTKTELMSQEVILEDFGGEVLSVEISAKQNINLDSLIDAILLQAEMLELKANKNRMAIGTVLESRVDKGRGTISSIILQHGTIKNGDIFVAGAAFGKVRTIYDDKGKKLASAGPSTPVEIVGFDSNPEPGDILVVVDSEQKAREIAEYRQRAGKESSSKTIKTIDQMMAGSGNSAKTLNILVKADVYGSLEAIVSSIESIKHPDVNVKVIEKGVGIISESDIGFAKNTGATVIGFNVNITSAAKESAKLDGVKILNHNIIYRMTEEIKTIMGSMLSPIVEEKYTGNADVRKIFSISKFGTIAGCYVTDGTMKRNDSKIKVMRNGKCIFEGKMRSMRHEKDEIKESRQSHECGILAEGFNDFKEGDQIECYEIILKSRSVD